MSTQTVKVGQVFTDNDRRAKGRRLVVISVGRTHAVMKNLKLGTSTEVRIARLLKSGSTGYTLRADLMQRRAQGKAVKTGKPGKQVRPVKLVIVNMKVLPVVKAKLEARAARFTRGNLSELLRRGAFTYKPKKGVSDFY